MNSTFPGVLGFYKSRLHGVFSRRAQFRAPHSLQAEDVRESVREGAGAGAQVQQPGPAPAVLVRPAQQIPHLGQDAVAEAAAQPRALPGQALGLQAPPERVVVGRRHLLSPTVNARMSFCPLLCRFGAIVAVGQRGTTQVFYR